MSLFLKIAIALPKDCHHESDTTFDLLFLRGGIHGDALTEGGRCNGLTSSISLLSLVVGSSTSSTKLVKEKLYLPNTCILNMRVRTSLACPCAPRSFCDHITLMLIVIYLVFQLFIKTVSDLSYTSRTSFNAASRQIPAAEQRNT